ncbi:MAG: Flp family type IVb pilin [Acidimicrobiia bacterium]|nr:Flp family type IVb pilin [Acidimicrobiia bacterium]
MNLYVMKAWLQARFSNTERGASMIEYVLLAALIAVVVIGVVTLVGRSTSTKFSSVDSGLQ